jgi:AcrR family transcriptional regulator
MAMAVIGRPRAFDRDAALDAATLVFWRKGFAAASMNDLCEAMGIRSPSLYAAFGSKEALYREAVDRYARGVGEQVWGQLSTGETARIGVQRLLAASAATLPRSPEISGGCMVQLGATADEWPATAADIVKQVRQGCLDRLQARLEAGVVTGEIPAATDVTRLSRFYLGVIQGMSIQARDGASADELAGMAEIAMAAWPGDPMIEPGFQGS